MKILIPFIFILPILFLAGCDQSDSPLSDSQINDKITDTFYCFATAESMAKGIDESYANDARQLQQTYLHMSAEKFCKSEQVDRFICITTGIYDGKDPDSVCQEPEGWDHDAFVNCSTDVQTFINTKVIPALDPKYQELESQFSQSSLDENAFLKKHYADNCKQLVK